MMVKPFLKWVGGKTQILDDVIGLFPREINNYHEPFLGGGSVLLRLLSEVKSGRIRVGGRIYASDRNQHLIGLYKNIQQCPQTVIDEVSRLTAQFHQCAAASADINRRPSSLAEALGSQESYYYWVRSEFNALSQGEWHTPAASAMFLFLNKTGFRGVCRYGPNGFNVPFGHYTQLNLESDHIHVVSELIQNVVFTACPFTESLGREVVAGDFVYLDPPYAPEARCSFVSYMADGFNIDNHNELFEICHGLRRRNIRWLMSNADVPLVRDAFPAPTYITRVVSCRRAINSKRPDSKTNEVLVYYGEE